MAAHSKTYVIPALRPFFGIIFFCIALIIFFLISGLPAKLLGIFSLITSIYTIVTYAPGTIKLNKDFILIKNLLEYHLASKKIYWEDVKKLEVGQQKGKTEQRFYTAFQDFTTLNIYLKNGQIKNIPLYLFQEDSVPFYRIKIKKIIQSIEKISNIKIKRIDSQPTSLK